MSGLGRFADGLASWKSVLAPVRDVDRRMTIFENMAHEVAGYVAKGLDKNLAVDELYTAAGAYGLIGHFGEDEVQFRISEAFETFVPEVVPDELHEEKPNGKARQRRATPYTFPDPAMIPPRNWLYGGHYVRGAVTATVAPGGFGKTTLSLFEAITMAASGIHAWYLSGEDPKVEIDRRIAAHCAHNGIEQSALLGNLFVDDRSTFPLALTKAAKGGAVIFDEQSIAQFKMAIKMDRIDVIIIDPFIAFHTATENDNSAMDQIIKRLGVICAEMNCNIELSHHVRKPAQGQAELTVDDTRGGGAIVNAVRSCRVINRMTSEQAEQAEIDRDKRSSYVRIDRGKRNMAPAEAAIWMHIVSVHLPNGDNVQAIAPWEFPKLFSNVSNSDLTYFQNVVRDGEQRVDPRTDNWLGHKLAERYSRHPKENKGDAIWIAKILATWVQTGALTKVKKYDPEARKDRWFYGPPGASPEPENTDQQDMDL
jgi:hypothetical protein